MNAKELNYNAPPELKYSIGRIENGMADLSVELFRLARQNYLFIGGAKHEQKRSPRFGVVVLNLERMDWEGLDEFHQRTIAATDIGEIAICAALFGDLNRRDQRAELGEPLVSHGPPYYAWETTRYSSRHGSPSRKPYDVFTTPQLMNVAKLMGPALKGSIDIVRADGFTLKNAIQKDHSLGGIYTIDREVETLGTIEIDGTDLPETIQPKSFDTLAPPLSHLYFEDN